MRLYICDVIGTGVRGDAYRSSASKHVGKRINHDMRAGTKAGKMICECNPTAQEHLKMLADPSIEYIPLHGIRGIDLNLTDPVSMIANRTAVKTLLEKYKIPFEHIRPADPVKKVIRTIIKRAKLSLILGDLDFSGSLDGVISNRAVINRALTKKGFAPSSHVLMRDVIREFLRQKVQALKTSYDN